MSANELANAGLQFLDRLEAFNDTLRADIEGVRDTKEKLSQIWNDTVREQFDTYWIPLQEEMQNYLDNIGPNHVETLKPRLEALIQYLNTNI